MRMSRGSCEELRVLTCLCKDLGHMGEDVFGKYSKAIDDIAKMLYSLIDELSKRTQ